MEITKVYAVALGGTFCMLLIISGLPLIVRCVRYLTPFVRTHLVYNNVLDRHRLLGPWSRAAVIIQLIYVLGNVSCLRLWDTTVSQAGLDAGTLAIINMVPLFAIPQLSTVADLLNVSLSTARQLHRSAGVLSAALLILHILVMVASRPALRLSIRGDLFALIGASSLGLIILLSLPVFRRPSYEIFLRTHQATAVVVAYSIWRHLSTNGIFPTIYLYISAGLFLLIGAIQLFMVLRQNGVFRYSRARARITYEHGAVCIRIQLQKPFKIKAGQAINLWIPSISFRSFLQSHPFVVISWANQPRDHIDLFVEARGGLTREMMYYAQRKHNLDPWVLFSGPYGQSVPVGDCENVLMVATGFGIAAHLPYLKQLIHGYNAREVRTRRIHLVWQVHNTDVVVAAQPLLNGALDEDTLDDGWILSISIYCESSDRSKSFGKRAKVYPGKAPLQDIVRKEMRGEYGAKKPVDNIDWVTKKVVEQEIEPGNLNERDGRLLITVSSTNDVRDDLRNVVRDHLIDGVSYFELDYQLSED